MADIFYDSDLLDDSLLCLLAGDLFHSLLLRFLRILNYAKLLLLRKLKSTECTEKIFRRETY